MPNAKHKVIGFEIRRDEIHGLDGGFFGIRRLNLANRRGDGTMSAPYGCDFVVRPKGVDAVVVALWHRGEDGTIEVLVREGLRPALTFGRSGTNLAIPDPKPYLLFTEVVAGIIERSDAGEAGVRRRAAAEVAEEAGYCVHEDAVKFLGAGTFPSPGSMPEKFWLVSAQVHDRIAQGDAKGDGSPMEEGADIRWVPLQSAIRACVEGTIEDAKTELVLRRLQDTF